MKIDEHHAIRLEERDYFHSIARLLEGIITSPDELNNKELADLRGIIRSLEHKDKNRPAPEKVAFYYMIPRLMKYGQFEPFNSLMCRYKNVMASFSMDFDDLIWDAKQYLPTDTILWKKPKDEFSRLVINAIEKLIMDKHVESFSVLISQGMGFDEAKRTIFMCNESASYIQDVLRRCCNTANDTTNPNLITMLQAALRFCRIEDPESTESENKIRAKSLRDKWEKRSDFPKHEGIGKRNAHLYNPAVLARFIAKAEHRDDLVKIIAALRDR